MTRIAEGGSAVRFVIGEYGSGKTFFLTLARNVAAEKKLVVMHADLSPERRLHASGGQARPLCAELVLSMSTRTKPEGQRLASVLERFLGRSAASRRPLIAATSARSSASGWTSSARASPDSILPRSWSGTWQGFEEGNEILKAAALRWLRAEYTLKTEAREALGVRAIVDDAGVYDHLKAVSRLIRLAGYDGTLDRPGRDGEPLQAGELPGAQVELRANLRIVNEVLQGTADRLGLLFRWHTGIPDGQPPRPVLLRGLAVAPRREFFRAEGLVDLSGPVIRLQSLTPEEMHVLLERLRFLWAGGDAKRLPVPDEALPAFLTHCSKKIGDDYFRTPRNTIRAFLDLLAILEQNPGSDWVSLLGAVHVEPDRPVSQPDIEDVPAPQGAGAGRLALDRHDEDSLATFRL